MVFLVKAVLRNAVVTLPWAAIMSLGTASVPLAGRDLPAHHLAWKGSMALAVD